MNKDNINPAMIALDDTAEDLQLFRDQLLASPELVDNPKQIREHAEAIIKTHFGPIVGAY